MSPEMQITVTMVGSIGAFIVALVIVAILVRVVGEKQDTAAEERKTLGEKIDHLRGQNELFDVEVLCEVKLLRDEVREYGTRTTNYIVFDHTANRIVGDVRGTVSPEGEVTKFRPFKIDLKYKAHQVRLLAILSAGEEAHVY